MLSAEELRALRDKLRGLMDIHEVGVVERENFASDVKNIATILAEQGSGEQQTVGQRALVTLGNTRDNTDLAGAYTRVGHALVDLYMYLVRVTATTGGRRKKTRKGRRKTRKYTRR